MIRVQINTSFTINNVKKYLRIFRRDTKIFTKFMHKQCNITIQTQKSMGKSMFISLRLTTEAPASDVCVCKKLANWKLQHLII